MAMSLGSAKGGGRRRGRARGAPISEINVTPLVDVMLVLLIVFMVAAPLMTMGVPIDLPQTSAGAMQPDSKPITITVTADGAISVEGEPVTLSELVPKVEALASEGTDERLYVRADTSSAYGAVMQVMGALSSAGYARIGLITEQRQAP